MTKQWTEEMRYRPWFLTYLRFIAVATVFHGIGILRDQNGWCLGDWLINYHAGFVRRGLTGEIALRVGHGVHMSPLIVVLLMQLACYAAMLFAVHRLVSGTRLQLWTAAALVSPAAAGRHHPIPRLRRIGYRFCRNCGTVPPSPVERAHFCGMHGLRTIPCFERRLRTQTRILRGFVNFVLIHAV